MKEQGTQRVAVRQIVFTGYVERWSDLARALGGDPVVTSPEYAEFEMSGGGLLGVHAASDEAPTGSCALQVVVADLDAARGALAAVGVGGTMVTGDFGRVLDVHRGPAGPDVAVVEGRVPTGPRRPGALMVTPLSLVGEIDTTVTAFEALGLHPVLRSDAGTFVEMVAAGGGEVLVHEGEGGAALSFQIDALDDLERLCREAGVEVEIVDETYGRTALISAPDGPRVWVNERQRDFYGYERLADAASV
ncbi:hypothetical protein [Dermacoccus nishinomiyaensis]|uniref:hypothetical protein n=2 Tax=Dermacoccus nishinomiyaensis TaxID=1274 RepID=UPI001EF52E1F|nr:hypothetical protein [Dermacoccus nishinomiyaensis]MCG7429750.1 hypothetical protein [Dermacoccus nishinomiyaensis]